MAKIKKSAVKKMQVGGTAKKAGPTYDRLRMGVNAENEEITGQNRDTKPTKQDSMAYEAGYNKGKSGGKSGPNERPVVRMGIDEGRNDKPKAKPYKLPFKQAVPKKKLQAGGVVKTTKRVGPVDPNGAYTKVQERTIAGKKAPKVPLKKDKQLGATKMKSGGKVSKKK